MTRHRTSHLCTALAVVAVIVALMPAMKASATVGTLLVSTDTTLAEDHNGPVVITADDVTLDCAGHTISGTGLATSTPGIALTGRTGVTVTNCTIVDFPQQGINVASSNGNTFSDNSLSDNPQGFGFFGSDDNEVIRNTVAGGTDWFAFGFFNGSRGNAVTENSATNSTAGFVITDGSSANVFTGNDASNTFDGFNVFEDDPGTRVNVFIDNTANDNSQFGFSDDTVGVDIGTAGTENTYTGNTCHRNAAGSYPIGLCSTGDRVGLVDPATGEWHLSYGTASVESFYFGNPGDVPFLGDWDCDGEATPGLFRQSDAFAYLRNANTQGTADIRFYFGNPSDVPLAGDFNGDGCDTLSIYRPSEQRFYIMNQLGENEGGLGAAEYSFLFGNPGDKPVVGDWDGDGIDEIGLHRETTGFFYYRDTLTTGIADGEMFFGDPGDRFVAGDWGIIDTRDTPAMFRPSNVMFYFRHTLTQGNADSEFTWTGAEPDWLPVSGDFTATAGGTDVIEDTRVCSVAFDDVSLAGDAADPACDIVNVHHPGSGYTLVIHGQVPEDHMGAFQASGVRQYSATWPEGECFAAYLFVIRDGGPALWTDSVRHFSSDGAMTEVCHVDLTR